MTSNPPWRTVKDPRTGRTIRYAVIKRGGRRIVLIKRGTDGKAN